MIKKFYKKRRNVSDLVTNSVHDTKTAEIKNKIPDLRDLIKKTNYNAKISGFEEKNTSLLLITRNLRVTYLMQR